MTLIDRLLPWRRQTTPPRCPVCSCEDHLPLGNASKARDASGTGRRLECARCRSQFTVRPRPNDGGWSIA